MEQEQKQAQPTNKYEVENFAELLAVTVLWLTIIGYVAMCLAYGVDKERLKWELWLEWSIYPIGALIYYSLNNVLCQISRTLKKYN